MTRIFDKEKENPDGESKKQREKEKHMTIANVCMNIEADKNKIKRREMKKERETFTTAELGTLERSAKTQEFKQSSGRVDVGDLKPLPVNSKNQTVFDS